MRRLRDDVHVYVWRGPFDMRTGFDRLGTFVREKLGRTPYEGVYVFVSRFRDRVKLLYWDRDGFAVWYKRLEAGAFRISLRDGCEEITGVDLEQLLSGTDLERILLQKNAEKGLYL
jgi:transposase